MEPGQLRRVDVDHIGFDGQTHRGELIVHQDLAPQVVTIFARLYRLGFPIEKIRTVDHYRDADDELSMEDDNTSAFNCRGIPGSDRWSQHAYGRAIDLNPRLNPCLYPTGAFQPQNAGTFWTATAPIRACCTTATRPCAPSPTAGGAGVDSGRRPSTTSISSGPEAASVAWVRYVALH